MGAAVAIIGLLGSAVSAYGQYSAGKQQKSQADRQDLIDRKNAAFAEAKRKRDTEALLKRQRTSYAKSGVEIEGTPLLVMEETARQAAIDSQAIKWSVNAQSNETKAAGQAAYESGQMQAGSSLLSGVSNYGIKK